MNTNRPRFPGGDRLSTLDCLRVPGGRHRDRYRENGPQTMDHVETEQRGDTQPVPVDRQPLQPVDLRRIGDEQQRTHLAPGHRGFDHHRLCIGVKSQRRFDLGSRRQPEVEILGQLTGHVGRGHPTDQFVHQRLHCLHVSASRVPQEVNVTVTDAPGRPSGAVRTPVLRN